MVGATHISSRGGYSSLFFRFISSSPFIASIILFGCSSVYDSFLLRIPCAWGIRFFAIMTIEGGGPCELHPLFAIQRLSGGTGISAAHERSARPAGPTATGYHVPPCGQRGRGQGHSNAF
nr:MAG TPA: hypothetical protein [Caudoviricetes sp.]